MGVDDADTVEDGDELLDATWEDENDAEELFDRLTDALGA